MTESLEELTKFVQLGARLDLKAISIEHILGNFTYITLIELLISLLYLF